MLKPNNQLQLVYDEDYVSPSYAEDLSLWGFKCILKGNVFFWKNGKITKNSLGDPALTINQLLAILPKTLDFHYGVVLTIRPYVDSGYSITYEAKEGKPMYEIWEATLVDALAKMAILLCKKGFIKIKNQCDGCRAGYKNRDGYHDVPGFPMLCAKHLYDE